MNALVIGYLVYLNFCASGAGFMPDMTCEDKSPATHIEMSIVTAENCSVATAYSDECAKHVKNLLEIRRNGDVVLTVPADVLSEKERELLFQAFIPYTPPQ